GGILQSAAKELDGLVVVRLVRPDDTVVEEVLRPLRLRRLAVEHPLADSDIDLGAIHQLLFLRVGLHDRLETLEGLRVVLAVQVAHAALELLHALLVDRDRRTAGRRRRRGPRALLGCLFHLSPWSLPENRGGGPRKSPRRVKGLAS